MNIDLVFEDLLSDFRKNPIDLLGIGDEEGEYNYLNNMGPTYKRTLKDVNGLNFDISKNKVRVLEIGAYLGFVSKGLNQMGFDVTAADLPIFTKSKNLQKSYTSRGIELCSINLSEKLPFSNDTFDVLICCETLEHLNFNPIPVIQEFYRVLKPGGYLYVSVPNHTKLDHRLKLLKGKSIYNPIDDLYAQINPKANFSVGLHWREYAKYEMEDLLKRNNFSIVKSYFFTLLDMYKPSLKFYIRSLWKKKNRRHLLLKSMPFLKETITFISQKIK
jgi:2-polyprenyl-3-methyl-5-hydroxy-6-metoxy-1,4-benzoquinol methylase